MRQKNNVRTKRNSAQKTSSCGAQNGAMEAGLHLRHATLVPARTVVHWKGDVMETVMTSSDKGTFLIRHLKEARSGSCPLLRYEILRIDAGRIHSSCKGTKDSHITASAWA